MEPEQNKKPIKTLIVANIIGAAIVIYFLFDTRPEPPISGPDNSIQERHIDSLEKRIAKLDSSLKHITHYRDSLKGILKKEHELVKIKKTEVNKLDSIGLDRFCDSVLRGAGIR